MAGTCIFCGEELKIFGKNGLVCGGVTQPVCNTCWEKYGNASQIERCRAVLKTGRAVEPEKIRPFLAEIEREEAEKQTEAERMGKLMNCCGQPMTPLGVSEFQLGRESFLLGSWSNILSGAMELGVFRCECCGQIKFMDPKFMKIEKGGSPG